MARWWIQEESAPPAGLSFDKRFAILDYEGDLFPHDLLSDSDVYAIYDDIFSQMTKRFEEGGRESLFYRGVDLLWCYKKVLFDYAYFAAQRHEAFARLVSRNPSDRFLVAEDRHNPVSPNLVQLLDLGPLAGDPRIERVGALLSRAPAGAAKSWKRIWPARLRMGSFSRCEAVLFSDYAKSQGVARRFERGRACYYSDSRSPKLFRWAAGRYGVFQSDAEGGVGARPEAAAFVENFGRLGYFSERAFAGLDAQKLLRPKIAQLFSESLPGLLDQIDAQHDFFSRATSLKSALLDEDVSPAKSAFCQIARSRGVRSFVECHGMLGHPSGYLPLTADRILVWGPAQKSKFSRWGLAAGRAAVTGCSKYERYKQMGVSAARKQVASDLKFDPARKIVVVAFTSAKPPRFVLLQDMRRYVSEILSAVGALSQAQIIVKMHPGDSESNVSFVRNWRESLGRRPDVAVLSEYDSLLLAKAADLLIVYRSTFAIDGFALSKPVICYADRSCRSLDEFRGHGAFFYAESEKELRQLAEELLASPRLPDGSDEAKRQLLNEGSALAPDVRIAEALRGRDVAR